MKDINGWIALAVFVVSCMVLGMNGFLLKHLNGSVLAMLAVSTVIVAILRRKGREKSDEASEKNRGREK